MSYLHEILLSSWEWKILKRHSLGHSVGKDQGSAIGCSLRRSSLWVKTRWPSSQGNMFRKNGFTILSKSLDYEEKNYKVLKMYSRNMKKTGWSWWSQGSCPPSGDSVIELLQHFIVLTLIVPLNYLFSSPLSGSLWLNMTRFTANYKCTQSLVSQIDYSDDQRKSIDSCCRLHSCTFSLKRLVYISWLDLLNVIWCVEIPNIITRWCESLPGSSCMTGQLLSWQMELFVVSIPIILQVCTLIVITFGSHVTSHIASITLQNTFCKWWCKTTQRRHA